MDAAKSQTMTRFMGLNNTDDPTRLTPIVVDHEYVYPLAQASNVEIDNTWGISSRSGYDDVLSGADIHSLWSDNVTCLFVDGVVLKKLNMDYSTASLRSPLTGGARVSYAPWNDRIYHTNGFEIGYVRGDVAFSLVDPEMEFKLPLPAGQLIEYYRACLYVAKDNVLYVSDPLCDYFDIRKGFKLFSSKITLLRAVDDGLYVGDDKIWWMKGDTMEEFDRVEAYSRKAIPFTDVRENGQHIGDGVKGNIAVWTGENGICTGDNSGTVINRTEERHIFQSRGSGTGFIRENASVRHYINSLY